jgi:NADH-quinone oxidoreductase subunit A
MMTNWAIAFDLAFVLALVVFLTNAGKMFGPKPKHEGDADIPYETGERPLEPSLGHMSVLYWKFAVLFVAFDVDLAFLLPWVLGRADLTLRAAAFVSLFIGLVGFMLAYFWKKGALECR